MYVLIDFDALAEEFNIPQSTISMESPVIDVPYVLDVEPTNINDPDRILADNVSKANAILNHVMREIDNGNFSPRMVEVAGQIINAINNSTSQLYLKNFNIASLQLKLKALQLKEREIGMLEKTGGVGNKNIIVTDRETILRVLAEGNKNLIEGGSTK